MRQLIILLVLLLGFAVQTRAQTVAPPPFLTLLDNSGKIVNNGCIWTYVAGTTTAATTWTDSALSSANTNPIRSDSAGRFTAFLQNGNAYKFVYESSCTPPGTHGTVYRTADNISAIPASNVNLDITGTAGETINAGSVAYLSDGTGALQAGQWYNANATNTYSSSTANYVGFATSTITSGNSGSFRISGRVTGLTSLVVGAKHYIGTSAGGVTATAPANQRFVGAADSTTSLVVAPNPAQLSQNISNDLVFTGSYTTRRDTSDAADNGTLFWTGGGAYAGDGSRGASLTVSGNEQSTTGNIGPGIIGMQIGNVSGSKLYVLGGSGATQYFSILGADGSATLTSSISGIGWQFTQTHGSAPSGIDVNYTGAAPNGTGNPFFRGRDTGATRFELRSNGGLANFSANNVNLSDARAKDILGPAPSQRALFRRIQFVTARYKATPYAPADVMVTAQQVRQVYPTLVTPFADGYLGVREEALMMRGLKVIQEMDGQLQEIESRMRALEDDNATLRARVAELEGRNH